jgi:Spy/CpxP family protein refolding chaperone
MDTMPGYFLYSEVNPRLGRAGTDTRIRQCKQQYPPLRQAGMPVAFTSFGRCEGGSIVKNCGVTIIVVLSLLLVLSQSLAYGGGRGHERRDYGDDVSALSGMNFTPEQAARIRALRDAHLQEVKPLRDRLTTKRGELRTLWMQDNPDEDKIRAAQQEIRGLRERLDDRRSAYHDGASRVMTPEQKREFDMRYPAWHGGMDRMKRSGDVRGPTGYGREWGGRVMHRRVGRIDDTRGRHW